MATKRKKAPASEHKCPRCKAPLRAKPDMRNTVRRLAREQFGEDWIYATLVVHIREDVPGFIYPVVNQKTAPQKGRS